MSELDFGPHEKCCVCGKLQPHRRCIEDKATGKYFCGINCKFKHERLQDEGDYVYARITGRNVSDGE